LALLTDLLFQKGTWFSCTCFISIFHPSHEMWFHLSSSKLNKYIHLWFRNSLIYCTSSNYLEHISYSILPVRRLDPLQWKEGSSEIPATQK
jgi:hypothetical protein